MFTGFAAANHDDEHCWSSWPFSSVPSSSLLSRWSTKKWISAACWGGGGGVRAHPPSLQAWDVLKFPRKQTTSPGIHVVGDLLIELGGTKLSQRKWIWHTSLRHLRTCRGTGIRNAPYRFNVIGRYIVKMPKDGRRHTVWISLCGYKTHRIQP